MSRIRDLIAELSPGGVDFRELGSMIKLNFGTRITKMDDAGALHPVYGGGGESFRTDRFNREDDYVVSRFALSAKCVRRVKGKFWMLDSGFTFDPLDESVDKDFVAYLLFNTQQAIYACSSQGAQKNLRTDAFKKFRLPVPPLEVQREIVRTLDTFTELETELEAELEARQRQRGYYATRIIDRAERQSDGTQVGLGTLVRVQTGKLNANAAVKDGSYPFFTCARDVSSINDFRWDTEAILISGNGYLGEVKHYKGKFDAYQRTYVLTDFGEQTSSRYLYFVLRTRFREWALSNAKEASVPYVVLSAITEFMLLLPPLDAQVAAVEAFEVFEEFLGDGRVGLPAELAARRKQYEYYRDRLLTFEEAPA